MTPVHTGLDGPGPPAAGRWVIDVLPVDAGSEPDRLRGVPAAQFRDAADRIDPLTRGREAVVADKVPSCFLGNPGTNTSSHRIPEPAQVSWTLFRF